MIIDSNKSQVFGIFQKENFLMYAKNRYADEKRGKVRMHYAEMMLSANVKARIPADIFPFGYVL